MKNLQISLIVIALLLVASCRSNKDLQGPGTDAQKASLAEIYKQKVVAGAQTAEFLTARVKMNIAAVGQDVSASGTLRMKRNDVVQLSLTMLGFEVGRLEFTPEGVLIIDRFHKQYVRAAYADVSFLRKANLDFHSLQALFWNELFVPGETSPKGALQRFKASVEGTNTRLSLDDCPQLNYDFITLSEDASIRSVSMKGKTSGSNSKFEWTYEDFTELGEKKFPTTMNCNVSALEKTAGFTLRLSRINHNSDWETRTNVSSKYKQQTADDILGRLLKL